MTSQLAAAFATVALALAAAPASAAASPVSSHAQLYTCCMPFAEKERLFAESKALGASYIRVDFELNAIFEAFGAPLAIPDWSHVDEVLELSQQYGLPVLGIVLATPTWVSSCPERGPDAWRCAPSDPAEYGQLAGELAAHARGVVRHWEIVNEPDGEWAFVGEPEEYARMLAASYDAIKARAPEDQVLMGGVMTPWETDWIDRVFATAGVDVARKFDIANLHLRGKAADLPRHLADWRATLAAHGFHGPAWVTEHGYAADPARQVDPGFVGGEKAQAIYLRRSLLGLAEGGAEQVFVTLRDSPEPEWASEGVIHVDEGDEYGVRRKPAFEAVRRFADEWPQIVEWRRQQHLHEQRAAVADELARSGELRLSAHGRRQSDARDALLDQAVALRRVRAIRCVGHRRRARGCRTRRWARAAAVARRAKRLGGELRRVERALREQVARNATYRGEQVANTLQALDFKRRIEG